MDKKFWTIIAAIIGFFFFMAFLMDFSNAQNFASVTNSTIACINSARERAVHDNPLMMFAPFTKDISNQNWEKFSCEEKTLTDDYGFTCEAVTGFKKFDRDHYYCSDLPSETIDQKIKKQTPRPVNLIT